jgi:hypothetical protein
MRRRCHTEFAGGRLQSSPEPPSLPPAIRMTSPSDRPHRAAGSRPPRDPATYIVIVEEQIEPRLACRAPCFYLSPPQLRPSALALVRLLLGRPTQEIGTGPSRTAIAGGEREIRLQRCLNDV